MKKRKIAKILLAAMLITGCNKAVQKPEEPANTIVERDEAVKELPYDPISLIDYINKNIDKVDNNKKELYILTLEDTLVANLNIVSGVVNSDECKAELSFVKDGEVLSESDIEKIEDSSIKNEIQKIYDMYYTVFKSGDSFVPGVDYEKILKLVDKDNKALADYYSIKLEENKKPTLFKGQVMLEAKDLLARINEIEKFVIDNKDFPRNMDFVARYQSWLYVLLTGTASSPLVDKDGKLMKEFEDLEKNLEAKTIADQTFLDGMYYIHKNNNKFDDELMDVIRTLVKQSVFDLKYRAEMK